MGVILRKRKLKKGFSYYLDINHNGERWREFLGAKIKSASNKDANLDKLRFAKTIQAKRELELLTEGYEIANIKKSTTDFTTYFKNYVDDYSKASKRKYEASYQVFSSLYPKVRGSELTHKKCELFKATLEAKYKSHTVQSYFSAFKSVVKQAQRDQVIRVNPVQDIKIKRVSDSIAKQVLTKDELLELANTWCGSDEIKRAFLFACNTGLGQAELVQVKWKDINNDFLIFKRAKNEEPLHIPLNKTAMYYLGESKSQERHVFSLPSVNGVNKTLKSLVKRAKIKKHVTFYCARHTYACNLLLGGANLRTVAKLMGHKDSSKATIKYLNYVESLNQDAVNQLPDIIPTVENIEKPTQDYSKGTKLKVV